MAWVQDAAKGGTVSASVPVRFWEIDFLRGLAVCLMILLHLLDDLYYFCGFKGIHPLAWMVWQRVTAGIFIILAGISLSLNRSRGEKLGIKSPHWFLRHSLLRGIKIFAWGMAVTLVTRAFLREGFVRFGVLHFLGLAMIAGIPFVKLRYENLWLGLFSLGIGSYFARFQLKTAWLFWLGIRPRNFFSVDYFPFFPWFGLVLWGIFIGNTLYRDAERRFDLHDYHNPAIRWGCFLGRNSLVLYLIHQPLFIAVLYSLGLIKGFRG